MPESAPVRDTVQRQDLNVKVTDFDLIIVGGGFCGATIGIKAHDLGLNVKVLDAKAHYPGSFRADKLEADQIAAMTALGLLDLVRPVESPAIYRVHDFVGDDEVVTEHPTHRGLHYQDTVNALRGVLRDRGLLDIQRVTSIVDGPDCSEVLLHNGEAKRARLVVVATGMEPALRRSLNLGSRDPDALNSMTFGFYVAPATDSEFRVSAFNARSAAFVHGLQYITFFPIGNRTRANLFTCWESSNERVRRFTSDTLQQIRELFPGLEAHIGPLRLCSEVESYATRYYRSDPQYLARTVLSGDAFQSVNPANGVGLSKCLADAQALVDLLPQLSRSNLSKVDLAAYYRDARKRKVDQKALKGWRWTNELATSQSLLTKTKKIRYRTTARLKTLLGYHQ